MICIHDFEVRPSCPLRIMLGVITVGRNYLRLVCIRTGPGSNIRANIISNISVFFELVCYFCSEHCFTMLCQLLIKTLEQFRIL